MPMLEYDYSDKDYQLVATQGDGNLSPQDYVRITVYKTNGRLARLPAGQEAIFYSSLSEEEFTINISPSSLKLDELLLKEVGGDKNDFQIFIADDESVYVKPNEIFNTFGLPEGNYKISIDFLNQLKPDLETIPDISEHYQFIVKEISTSRKEIRLKLVNANIEKDSNIIQALSNDLNFGSDSYAFRHLVSFGTTNNIPIMNYHFDPVTDGKDNQSIILRLYQPVPRVVNNLNKVTIEREVLITQTTDVFYFSDVPPSRDGSGLIPDEVENWITSNQNENQELQNFNDLTSSISDQALENVLSSSAYDYPNLNTDFKLFENHTFFGSAKRKLENFKNKVETIQDYYGKISSSLSSSGVSLEGDPNYILQYREDLFNKVNNEINSFTPYERFLYFDGQQESTASAPGVGKNYIKTSPVSTHYGPGNNNHYIGELNGGDGFDAVYHHSSKNLGTNSDISLFSGMHRVENKPFYNNSGSIYLSFLMKGNDGISLTWENNNTDHTAYYRLPEDSMYGNTISSPTISGSHYQRFIFEASQSYWVPTIHAGLGDHDIAEISCWGAGSNEIEILSGSIKTGSNVIKDSSGKYMNITPVTSQSGVPFKGSVLPAGELFKVYHTTTLSQSLSGSWNVDDQTSGSTVTNDMLTDFSGRENSGSVDTEVKVSDGVIHPVTNRQYGQSFYFQSESANDVRFYTDADLNYNKDDNFSLSVWAKRFHPDTASADPTSGNVQGIFIRGHTATSYGIDYYYHANQIRAGVRGGVSGTTFLATHNTTDDLLDWHHLAFTYESGSSTGIKLYVDGELKDSESTLVGGGFTITASRDFSASAALVGSTNDALNIGGADVTGGSGVKFNGFIQYPRIYNRVLSQEEVTQLYNSPDSVIESKITDVRVSLKDPTNAQPFSNLYHTSSAEWTSWYDGMYDAASTFDTENIHSLENNSPNYIQQSNEYDEFKDFLALQGEHYDVIRNHIDGLGTLNDRGYDKFNSPPTNTYPMLLNNIGWEAINPFSGSLTDTLGGYLNGITSIDDIKNNTWRKTLNNLLYVYKTKGTENSVRALMNIYGYPPDVLRVKSYGGATDDIVDSAILSNEPPSSREDLSDTNLQLQSGSIGYIQKKEKLWNYMFQGVRDRSLHLPWWINNADVNTIEFIHKHKRTTNAQTILKSSGSGAEHLWDLRLVPSTDGLSGSFEFRLNNSNTGSSDIASNGISMSLDYSLMVDGQLWNVMLQRMTGSISGSGTNEYRLHAATQGKNPSEIKTYNYVTMSISGGLTNTYVTGGADSNYYANQNWQSSGSRNYLDTGSLLVGGDTFSGSLSQIKGWTTPLSMSKFRKHVLNKFSTIGNSIISDCKELVYHFKLNENYSSASISSSKQLLYIVDSSPKHELVTNHSFPLKKLDIITGSCAAALYGYDTIDTIKLGINSNAQDNQNDNNIIINPSNYVVSNLNPNSSIFTVTDKKNFKTSDRLEINTSPQDTVNNHILNSLDTFNFENYYGNPQYYYSSSYENLDNLRNEFFDCQPILVNVNQFIRAQENIFNPSVTNAVKTTAPARTTLSDKNANIGVTIKPNILERQKIEHERASVETNPNSPSGSLSMVSTGSYQHNFVLSSLLELPHSASLSMGSAYISESIDGRFTTPQFLQPGGYTASLETEKTGSISPLPKFTGSLEVPLSSSISFGSNYISESNNNRTIVPPFIQQGGVTSSVDFPKSGSIEEITTQYTKEFVNIHDSFGKEENDTHFINFASKVKNTQQKSKLDLRFANSASADSTITLTSIEAGDYVNTGSTSPNLDELTFKTKTYLFVSHSGTANLDYNGAFSADSSSVHVLTGSNSSTLGISGSQANNLKAAISSSNGHGDSFGIRDEAAADQHRVFLTNKVAGPIGNTLSASFNTSMELSLIDNTASPLPFTGGSLGVGDFNNRHIEPRYNFIMIGDTEHYSASLGNSDVFNDISRFSNQVQVTFGPAGDFNYEHLHTTLLQTTAVHEATAPYTHKGKRMGKTRFYRQYREVATNNKFFAFPANHVSKFSYPFKEKMYEGAQNVSPGFLNTQHEDYSTSSFYRVKVTGGENQIIVKGNSTPEIDSNDNIIY